MTTVRTVPRQVPVFMAVVALDSSEGSKTATLTLDSINIHWITMTLGQCRLSHRGGSNCRTRRCKHRCRSNWCSRGRGANTRWGVGPGRKCILVISTMTSFALLAETYANAEDF